ncbi:MAG: TonB-dependent receptor [Pirellulales bacterium]
MGQFRDWAPFLCALCGSALAFSLLAAGSAGQVSSAGQGAQAPADSELPGPSNLDASEQDVLGMDLEQLATADVVVPAMDVAVSSVSRQESTIGRSPAAVFVITPEMIRRSSATTIPELLRMVPGIEVARIDANKWAISSRGFNSRFANDLLVQIDGRSVYVQSFGGVYWDTQDVVLQDIERIEVIRGPGATVWGANAVNGVINIITKRAKDTQGLLVVGGTGTEERGFSTVRYGGTNGDDLHWRVYGKQFERDGGYFPDAEFDDWRQGRGGFRADWTPTACDTLTLQGDFYEGVSGSGDDLVFSTPPFLRNVLSDSHVRGQNYLTRWTHVIDDDSDWSLQLYSDHYERVEAAAIEGQRTFDIDFQYRFPVADRHNVICGAGFRDIDDRFFGSFTVEMIPAVRSTDLYSCFVQDEITLEEDRWYLIAGSKFEHNDFTGFEYQPSVRLLHLPSERESVWAAVSRAVRTPSRVEHNFLIHGASAPFVPVFVRITGDDAIVAEELLAFEIGYRAQPTDEFSWDLAAYYNNYEKLIGVVPSGGPFFQPGLGTIIPLTFANSLSADTYGAELTSTYKFNPKWQMTGSYSLLYMDVHAGDGDLAEGSSPHNQLYVRSSWTPRCDLEFDLIGRYVDSLPALGVDSYLTMDARIAWKPRRNLEWAVVGRNLLDSKHLEFVDALAGQFSTEVQPEIYTTLTWTY